MEAFYASGAADIMVNNFMQWVAIIVEFLGLALVAIELYLPKSSESLKVFFEETKPKFMRSPKVWIASYIFIWVVAAIGFSILDQSMSLIANIFFTVFTVLVLLILAISKTLVRLGVVLGRGNSVAGVGLVLALIGFSIEIVQLASS